MQGWRTTDEDEIALRRWRGRTDIVAIEALEPEHAFFGTFRAQSGSGNSYEVEIRSLDAPRNSCGCIDRSRERPRRTCHSRVCSPRSTGGEPERSGKPWRMAARASRFSLIVPLAPRRN